MQPCLQKRTPHFLSNHLPGCHKTRQAFWNGNCTALLSHRACVVLPTRKRGIAQTLRKTFHGIPFTKMSFFKRYWSRRKHLFDQALIESRVFHCRMMPDRSLKEVLDTTLHCCSKLVKLILNAQTCSSVFSQQPSSRRKLSKPANTSFCTMLAERNVPQMSSVLLQATVAAFNSPWGVGVQTSWFSSPLNFVGMLCRELCPTGWWISTLLKIRQETGSLVVEIQVSFRLPSCR